MPAAVAAAIAAPQVIISGEYHAFALEIKIPGLQRRRQRRWRCGGRRIGYIAWSGFQLLQIPGCMPQFSKPAGTARNVI
jgi:hypothetical protein